MTRNSITRTTSPPSPNQLRQLAQGIRENAVRAQPDPSCLMSSIKIRSGIPLDAVVRPNQFVLCDTSTSMESRVRGRRRIDLLMDALELVFERCPETSLIAFASGAQLIEHLSQLPQPYGGTNLAAAFDLATEHNAQHLVVLSDGCPNSRVAAFDAARRTGCPIDIVFCGDPHDHDAKMFMEELAKLNRGKVFPHDLNHSDALRLAGVTLQFLLAGPDGRP